MNTPNKMNNFKPYFFIVVMCLSVSAFSQTKCDELEPIVTELLNPTKDNSNRIFISDGQVYKAFISDEENAEFKATLYGGSTYRIAGSTAENKALIFSVYDSETSRNLLFSNKGYDNSPYWDFKVENTIDCYIVTTLDLDIALSGCMMMMIGFEKK